jgi:ubiquinone/menaquinone biosynthesis C-methylase UbiE
MSLETFAKTGIGKLFINLMAKIMESRLRYRFFNPVKILQGIDNLQGKNVLEPGCGTGFFTISAAELIGVNGSLTAMDILSESVEFVSKKVSEAGLQNVRVLKGDILKINLEPESFHVVILFGVIPAPMLPLSRVLQEMHRVLKPGGILAFWPPVPFWFPQSVVKSGLFSYLHIRNGVCNFKRC